MNTCSLNLLLNRSHQADKLIIVKRLIQGCNNMTRVWYWGLNPGHVIRIVIKHCLKNLPTKFSHKFIQISSAIFYFSEICWGPLASYFAPIRPSNSLTIIRFWICIDKLQYSQTSVIECFSSGPNRFLTKNLRLRLRT